MSALEKLKIIAYKDSKRIGNIIGTFEVMFNPESYTQSYSVKYSKLQGINTSGRQLIYSHNQPKKLKLKLIIDNTVYSHNFLSKQHDSVNTQIDKFLKLTCKMNGAIHEPNYLKLKWGSNEILSCRLISLDITYKVFDKDGTPLRAELDVIFLADQDNKEIVLADNKQSPDLTHARMVLAGDKLPAIAKQIYDNSLYYIQLAQFNGLNNFRKLKPAQVISCPPLDNKNR